MAISMDDPFVAPPRISRGMFAQVLREQAAEPVVAERDPGEYWDAIVATGVDPAFMLAMFAHESGMGKAGVARQTHSWGNTRMPTFGVEAVSEVPGASGVFPVFRDWRDGAISTAARLATTEYVYSGPSVNPTTHERFGPRRAIREVFEHPSTLVWAPAGDFNDPKGYLRAVLDFMNRYADQPGGGTVSIVPQPAITVKHITANYGGYAESRQVEAMVVHISNGSLESNLNWFANPGSQASTTYEIGRDGTIYEIVDPNESQWTNGQTRSPDTSNPLIAAWVAGGINPNTRTEAIELEGQTTNVNHENVGGELTDAQWDSLVHLLAWRCQERGLPIDRTHILGHYQIDNITRWYCPGLSPAEWDDLIERVRAVAAGPTADDRILVGGNPLGSFGLRLGFRAWAEALGRARNPADVTSGILSVTGWPREDEWQGADGCSYQRCERLTLKYEPGAVLPWDVVVVRCDEQLPTKVA